MRIHWIAAFAALALLVGCNSANQGAPTDKPATPAIAPGTTITGSVSLRDAVPVGAGAKLDVRLVDVAQPEIAIAEKSIDVSGAPPYSFSLDFDPGKLTASRTYVVNAVLTDGQRRFLPVLNSPVLTHGAGTNVQVVLNAEATPAERLKEEVSKLQSQIGGMKKVAGTYTTDDASVGWDAFATGSSVRYVRVNTEFDKGGRTSVNYAFKDDKPIAAKQNGGGYVGWNDAGEVMWNEKPGGGSLSDDEVQSLHDSALKALQMAQEKVDAAKKK
ncbi:MAG TPA: YbaY family lipoprotein [Dokdonella sp.]